MMKGARRKGEVPVSLDGWTERRPRRRKEVEEERRGSAKMFGGRGKALKREGLGSNPGEDMDVCKCIVPARHGGTLNSRRAASPFVRLVEGEERWKASDHPQSVPLNWGGIEPNRSVTCMVLKATANVMRHLSLCHDEFRGPRSGLCRSGGVSNNSHILIIFAAP
ncbi:uncharacterized protein TNCV_1378761 [Trichonephila clavipes]|nr:uncharacterized protein TNCV_1378761 [Trichonephila clavipes]